MVGKENKLSPGSASSQRPCERGSAMAKLCKYPSALLVAQVWHCDPHWTDSRASRFEEQHKVALGEQDKAPSHSLKYVLFLRMDKR